jgi:hypothetical protein
VLCNLSSFLHIHDDDHQVVASYSAASVRVSLSILFYVITVSCDKRRKKTHVMTAKGMGK